MANSVPEFIDSSTPSPRVSIRDVAREVGVSIMTVSLSLRNNPKISEATRRRVQAAAKKLGYRPDPEVARLMTRLHHLRQTSDSPPMAIVDLSPTRLPPGTEDYCEMVRRGAVARAESLGYIATCFHRMDYEGDVRRLLKVLRYRGVRGILLLPPLRPVELPEGLDWAPFSVIVASYAITPLQFHRVVPHQFVDMCRLIKLLEGRGFRRIGAVFEDHYEERIQFHFTASLKLLDYGDNILRVKQQDSLSRADLVEWIKCKQPDALVCPFALKLSDALPPESPTFRRPVIISLRAVQGTTLSYWDERPEEIGSDAALLLAGMIQHNETGVPDSPRTSLVHGIFHDATTSFAKVNPAKKKAGAVKTDAATAASGAKAKAIGDSRRRVQPR